MHRLVDPDFCLLSGNSNDGLFGWVNRSCAKCGIVKKRGPSVTKPRALLFFDSNENRNGNARCGNDNIMHDATRAVNQAERNVYVPSDHHTRASV